MPMNKELLHAFLYRAIPTSEFLAMSEPLDNLQGEERITFQNQLAKEIEAKYPLDPEWAPKTKTSAPDTAETNNSPSLQTIS